jgi:hypothetical protein
VLCALLPFLAWQVDAADPPTLGISRPDQDNWVRLDAPFRSNMVYRLEASSNLTSWATIAVTHEGLYAYPDTSPAIKQRFYRVATDSLGPTNELKNQILFPLDRFLSASSNSAPDGVRWIKFAILTDESWRVFYQPSAKYLFHYDFATRYLDPFFGLEPAEFDALTLHTNNQRAVLGAVLFPPSTNVLEFGIQFAGFDLFPVEQVAAWCALVRATVHASETVRAFYIPSSEQRPIAEANRDFFADRDIPLGAADRWTPNQQCYAPGWAVGRLVYIAGPEIDAAYALGALTAADILVTDVVPAEVPFVAGIISLSASTPNSHVAILSRAFGNPFVYVPEEEEQTNLLALVGREILLRTGQQSAVCEIKIVDLEGALEPVVRSQLLAMKAPPPLRIPRKETFGGYVASTDSLQPSDIRYFGGKAANYGLLRRSIPANAPPALAFSFDLWDDFMDQVLPGTTNTLRFEIAARLAPFGSYPPDIPALQLTLDGIRNLITGTAQFSPELRIVVTNALNGFTPTRRIRFRSSTNVEDSEQFTGAGLYDSFSGCLLDDLDDDTRGPSHCEPDERNERGVFRAIQRVYASFYNNNAFLERLRHGVDETQVAMGVLVHYSYPDEEELANGVATLEYGLSTELDLVTQLGAESVTNPNGLSIPEMVRGTKYSFGLSLDLVQRSSLVPLGDYVMAWDTDYIDLANLLLTVADSYRALHTNKARFVLDYEYKKTPDGLVVKQVREVPRPSTNSWYPFLINEPVNFRVFQGEYGTVFGNHMLKSFWSLQTTNRQISPTNLDLSFYTTAQIEYLDGASIQNLSGPLASFPNFDYSHGESSTSEETGTNRWTVAQQQWTLRTIFPSRVVAPRIPIITQSDLRTFLDVGYPTPQTVIENGVIRQVTAHHVRLENTASIDDGDPKLQTRTLTGSNGLQIITAFCWPTAPVGPGGYTAPLLSWKETQIIGLTPGQIILRGDYAQTYRPGHHNFSEEFIFEPRLEPNLPAQTLLDLEAANVQLIYVSGPKNRAGSIWVRGTDQQFRRIY